MERYWQEVGQTGRDGLPATSKRRNLVKLACDISKAYKNMTDTTRTFIQSK